LDATSDESLEGDPPPRLSEREAARRPGPRGRDVASPQYTQTLTGKDDLIKGDEYMDLKFTKLIPGLKYWLEVDPGGGGPKHMAFEAVPWADIKTD
jgi:hypothetical protein